MLGSFKQCWHILISSQKNIFAGTIPIAILITILSSFSLFYKNLLEISDHYLKIKEYSLILDSNTSQQEVEEIFQIIKGNPQVSGVKKISPAQTEEDILSSFDLINKKLKEFDINQLPFIIEFSLDGTTKQIDEFSQEIKKHPIVYDLVSGLEASDQVKFFITIIDVIGIVFLIMLVIGMFYIITNTIQVTFLNLFKEIEILIILGATNMFIFSPFILVGIFIVVFGFVLGMLTSYILLLLVVALLTFNEGTFFINDLTTFFSSGFLFKSFFSLIFISIVSSWHAIYNVIKKIDF